MFQVANLLKGFGPTSGSGSPPAAPTITVVDNGDGTATLTVSGSSLSSSNAAYTQLIGGSTWTLGGSRTSDGTITLTLADGRYFAYVLSTLNDQIIVSNVVVFTMGQPAADLIHSPAHILARLLTDLGLTTLPSAHLSWPAFVDSKPDQPDNVVVCYNTSGVLHGRDHTSGETQEHYGVQVYLRAVNEVTGYQKMNAIQNGIDQTAYNDTVTIDGTQYLVYAITRKGGILSLGKEVPQSKRNVYTLNVVVALEKVS